MQMTFMYATTMGTHISIETEYKIDLIHSRDCQLYKSYKYDITIAII